MIRGMSAVAVAALVAAAPARAGDGCYGTAIDFVDSPKEAAALAKKQEKLVLVLHVSGHFETPEFTWNNAEALRVNALANPQVGKFVNEHFVSAFQKVATFRIVSTPNGGPQKQGGNVAAYFCAPDGRVLHCVAGPVDAQTMLRELKWVVETAKQCIAESNGDGGKFKALFRTAHAKKLQQESGVTVSAVTYDPPDAQGENDALTFRDPSGQPLAPRLPPPPIDGPDVTLKAADFAARQEAANNAPGARYVVAKGGRRVVANNQTLVHQIMAAHALVPIERVYGTVFENILGEKISTKPVEVTSPFSWMDKAGNRVRRWPA